MNAEEAVRRVEEWLRNSPDGDLTTGGTAALRIREDYVVETTGGWNVSYNTVGWLDGTDPGKGLFPGPVVFVPADGGAVTPDPASTASGTGNGQVTVGAIVDDGYTEWVAVVDPEFDATDLPGLGTPERAVIGWEQHTLHGTPTGVYRANPAYKIGPRAHGLMGPSTPAQRLLGYAGVGWISPDLFRAQLLDLDVYVLPDKNGEPLTAGEYYRVYTSPELLPAKIWSRRRIQPRVLLRGKPDKGLWFNEGALWDLRLSASSLSAAHGIAPHPALEREPVDDVPAELRPEFTACFPELETRFGSEAAALLRQHIGNAGQSARQNGYELTVDECVTYARAYAFWIGNLRARYHGLPARDWPADLPNDGLVAHRDTDGTIEPAPWTFGKFRPAELAILPERGVTWHRLLGAFVGFAIGDALGAGADPAAELPLGGLTRQLLLNTESLICGVQPVTGGVPATLPAVGRPDSWVTKATAHAGPAPADFSALMAAALPAAVSTGVEPAKAYNYEYATELVHEMIGAMASGTEAGTATDALVWLLQQAMFPQNEHGLTDGRVPLWLFLESLTKPKTDEKPFETDPAIKELAETVLALREDRRADDEAQFTGSTPLAVLGKALLAATKWAHEPERALKLAARGGPVAGALAGALIGAWNGVPGLPQPWVKGLYPLGTLDGMVFDAFNYFNRAGVYENDEALETTWADRYPSVHRKRRQPKPAAPTAAAVPWRTAPETRSRLRGSLLAGAIGDALGAKTEFDSIDRIREIAGPAGITDFIPAYGGTGRITDDTQMTLFTMEAVIRAHAEERRGSPADLVRSLQMAYQRWLHTQGVQWPSARGPENTSEEPDGWLITHRQLFSRRAPGLTCFSELEAYGKTGVSASVDRPVNNSKGCGGVMRAAPIALWSDDLAKVFELGAASAALTHGHPSGFLSSGAFAVIMNLLLQGKPLLEAVAAAQAELVKHPGHEEQTVALEQALKLVADGPPTPEKLATLGEGNIGETALSMSVYVALATTDVNSALLASVNHSGDSDSTGSICGNLVGAMYGDEALRKDLLERLELREVIETLADDALSEFGPDAPSDDRWHERYPDH